MSKFYIEDPSQVYGCFRCGIMMGDIKEAPNGVGYICEGCGEQSVITFLNALDILNNMHLQGDLSLDGEDTYLDDFIEEE